MLDQLTFEMWLEAERTWMQFGSCRTGKLPGIAWRCGENGTMEIAGKTVDCAEVTKAAVQICQTCPVQWSCTKFAVQVEAEWSTWGCRMRHLRWLQELEEWDAVLILDDAEKLEIPVEIAVRDAKKLRRGTGSRVSSAA